MLNRFFEAVDGQRIFGADVDQSFGGTDGVTADAHRFYNRVRVAFHDGAVHEGAGVAFVGVADNVLYVRYLLTGKFPFQAGGETATATSPQSGAFDDVDDVGRLFVEKAVGQCEVSFTGDVFFYIFGVDESAVAQGDAELFPVEVHVFGVTDSLFGLRVYVEQPFDSSSSDDVFADDFLRIFGSDLGIERIVRNDLYDGALFAEAEAAYCDDVYFVGYPVSFNGFLKIFSDALTGRGFTTGTSANKNLEVCCSGRQPATFFGNLFITFFAQ